VLHAGQASNALGDFFETVSWRLGSGSVRRAQHLSVTEVFVLGDQSFPLCMLSGRDVWPHRVDCIDAANQVRFSVGYGHDYFLSTHPAHGALGYF
jgi:hypothetical protein